MDKHTSINTTNYTDEVNQHRLARFGNAVSAFVKLQGGGTSDMVPQVCMDWDFAEWADLGGTLTVDGNAWLTPTPLTGITALRICPKEDGKNWDLYIEEYQDTRYQSF